MRHAKSNHAALMQSDFERELNDRGQVDALNMGARLKKRGLEIDQIISSTARRALQTTIAVAKPLEYSSEQISWVDSLYHAPESRINDTILSIENVIHTALIVCHNPGATIWANEQTGFITENMPTSAMIAFEFEGAWSDYLQSKKNFLFYDFPKNLAMI
jgi:phosphohistidine phosphatase